LISELIGFLPLPLTIQAIMTFLLIGSNEAPKIDVVLSVSIIKLSLTIE